MKAMKETTEVIELHPMQAEVYELLRQGLTPNEMAERLGYAQPFGIYQYLNQLVRLGAVRKLGRRSHFKFIPIIDQYKVGWGNVRSPNTIMKIKAKMRELEYGVNGEPTYNYKEHTSPKQRELILKHYGKVTRSELAEVTGLSRFHLNMAIIQMGLSNE